MDQELIDLIDLANRAGQLVTKCWTPTCMQMRIASWPPGQWVAHPSGIPAVVSHGLCPGCAQLLDQSLKPFFQNEGR